jgi:hypothetical protein
LVSVWVVVTHPFHRYRGERLRVLFERRLASGVLLVCEGVEPGSTVSVLEAATDRGCAPAERPLTLDVLVEVCAVVAAMTRS